MYRVLVCDDQQDIVNALRIYLSAEGYEVRTAHCGEEALTILNKEQIHLVLLDIMMPGLDGIAVTARIREFSNVPILLLTAKSETQDKVLGLNMGADDYVTKPFVPVEVLARVRSLLRRYARLGAQPEKSAAVLELGAIRLDDRAKAVSLDGEAVSLTPIEYDILKLLLEHPGQVFSTRDIYARVWGENPYGSENAVAVHIRHLREKIEIDPSEPRYLKVVWGRGYKLEGGRR